MSVATELTRIQGAKADLKTSIESKGVTVPSSALINEYAGYVDAIQTGGGGGDTAMKENLQGTLTSYTIPNDVTSIRDGAFYASKSLTSVIIPNSVTSIGGNAFSRCTGLTSVTIPDSVTKISDYTFNGCTGLTSVTIPNSVTEIGMYSFSGCNGVTSITLPDSLVTIDANAFFSTTGLTSVVFGSGLKTIKKQAFYLCSNLSSVTFGNSLQEIEQDAFANTAWYKSLPNGLNYAGTVALVYKGTMPSGTEITLNSGTLGLSYKLFSGEKNLVSLKNTDDIIVLSENALNNTGITSISLPNIQYIRMNGLAYNTNLTSIDLGANITDISANGLYGNSSLTSLTVRATTPPFLGLQALYGFNSKLKIYVPAESVETYKTNGSWMSFSSRIEAIPTA